MKKIVSFSPFAEIWAHSAPESIFLKGLSEKYEVIQIRCRGHMIKNCTAMVANNINLDSSPKNKKIICNNCLKKNNILYQKFKINYLFLEDLIDNSNLLEIENFIEENNNRNYQELMYKEIHIGKLSLFEYLVDNKIQNIDLKLKDDEKLKIVLKNAMIAIFATEKVFLNYKPDYLLVYNSLYSMNRVVCALALKFNIKSYAIHSGSHYENKYSQIQLYKWNKDPILLHKTESWLSFKKNQLNIEQIKDVKNQILSYMSAKSVFTYSKGLSNSSKREILKKLGIENYSKIVTALMSSEDELKAAEVTGLFEKKAGTNVCFKNMSDWIENLINYFKKNPTMVLIIRVHPREFPNKRESIASKNISKLNELFKDLPINVIVNWPGQDISIYEIFMISDLILNQNSSSGLEAAAMGVNTLVHDPSFLNSYPVDIGEKANTIDEYFSKIELLLNQECKIEKIEIAFKYIYFTSIHAAFNLSNKPLYNSNPLFTSSNRIKNLLVLFLKYLYKKFQFTFYEKKKLTNYGLHVPKFESIYETLEHNHDYYVDNCLNKFNLNSKEKNYFKEIQKVVKELRETVFVN